ncbi:MAG TPA: AraC family transcriptional regulator [Spongiibacteraceae bacterium]|nr:AraC family transcriptional regulator [Spongiibacteraceae bacterium]HCS29407.1 AraC family transcriptional regulator [Spongiibacteraceae bacterium]
MTDTALDLQDSSFVVQLVYPAMVELGLDVELIAERCHITPDLLQSSQVRYPHAAQHKFWQVVEEVSGDPLIGLHLAEKMAIHKGQVWEYLFLSSPTFGHGLRRTLDFQRLVSDASDWQLEVDDDDACLRVQYTHSDNAELRHLSEASMYYMIRYFQTLTQDGFVPTRIGFSHPAAAPLTEYAALYGCEVAFEQAEPGLHFPARILEEPSSRAEPELLRLHEQLANERLAKLEKQDVVIEVRSAIAEILERGQPELTDIAERLGISPRVLRSRLTEADTSFNQVLSDYRCYLAKRLLSRTEESVGDVVYLTGFSEPSTFYRAFKRWTNMTPVEYREYKSRQMAEPPKAS